MDPLATIYLAIDTLLIWPYRLIGSPAAGFWLGTAALAAWCVVLGEVTMALAYLWNRSHYDDQNGSMVRMHNVSVQAIASGDKRAYKAGNKLANEAFGKCFFAQMALFATSLWPVPFALGWLATRFSGVDIPLGVSDIAVGYSFVCIGLYILLRVGFSRFKGRLPLFSRVAALMDESGKAAEDMVSWRELERTDTPA